MGRDAVDARDRGPVVVVLDLDRDDGRRLVAVPHDAEQVDVEPRVLGPVGELVLGLLGLAPVLLERLDRHRDDRGHVLGADRADRVAVRQVGHAGQRVHRRPEHLGVPADRLVAAAAEHGLELLVAVEHVAHVPGPPVRRDGGRDLAAAALAPGDERLADPEAPGVRARRAS